MKCRFCEGATIKAGKQKNGQQRYCCKVCKKYQQRDYRNKAYTINTSALTSIYLEGCGIRSLGRIFNISLLPFVGYVDGSVNYWELPESINHWSTSTINYMARHCGKHMHAHKSPKLLVEIVTEMFQRNKLGQVEKMFLERIGQYCYQGYWESEKKRINQPSPKIKLP